MSAICVNRETCGYTYFDGTGSVTGFSRSGTALTIDGVNLNEPSKIEMANVDCKEMVLNEAGTQITCTLDNEIPGGTWFPVVTEDHGLVPLDASVTAETVAIAVTSVSKTLDIN